MINFTGTYTDQYQLTMAQIYFLEGWKNRTAVFDYHFRRLPFNGGYAVFAGLENLLDLLETLRFNDADLTFLSGQGLHPDFIAYLANFSFTGTVYSMREGDLVFPWEPVVCIEAEIIQAQIVETLLLNLLNMQTLIATKASRMRLAAGDRKLVDFGLRRAQATGGYYASRAAAVGGFDATSNVRAGRDFNIPVSGTMAHSFIQSYDSEIDAFRAFAKGNHDDCVLLVDTYDTTKSGLPNAITVAKEMKKQGRQLKGIRLDSGDLSTLSRQAREMLDQAGLSDVKIAVSNELDEYRIQDLIEKKAPIDLFGVGTRLATGQPDAALDGVYKLAAVDGSPRIKLSENCSKITIPHLKQVYRILDTSGDFAGMDAVCMAEEALVDTVFPLPGTSSQVNVIESPKEPLLKKVMENGQRIESPKSISQISRFREARMNLLPDRYKQFKSPAKYITGLSSRLYHERNALISKYN